jgi:hypothetical protein
LPASDEGRRMKRRVPLVLVAVAVVAASSCGSSSITSDRIERVIEPTFARLVQQQVSSLKLRPMQASDVEVAASCRRVAAGADAGAGDWVCRLSWFGPDRQPLHDSFDLLVTPDGCYTATAEGDHFGGPTLRATDGTVVRNLLYVFEGCFDAM